MKSYILLLLFTLAFSKAPAQNAARVIREEATHASTPSPFGNWHLTNGGTTDYSYSGNHGSYFGALHPALIHAFDTSKFRERVVDYYERCVKVGWNIFDNTGNIIEQHWIAGKEYDTLENYLDYFFVYNSGLLIKATSFYWNKSSQAWKPEQCTTYSYDGSRQLTSMLIEKWEQSLSSWQNDERHDYVYSANGQKQDLTVYKWFNNTWGKWRKVAYLYKSGREYGNYIQNWHYVSGQMGSGYLHRTFGYDGNGNREYDTTFSETGLLIGRWASSYNSFNQPTVKYWQFWNHPSSQWVPVASAAEKYEYTYETYTNDVNELKRVKTMRIYPSPANTVLFVNIDNAGWHNSSLSISDMNGRLVIEQPMQTGKHSAIDVSGLPSGLYVIKVNGPGSSVSKLFAVQH